MSKPYTVGRPPVQEVVDRIIVEPGRGDPNRFVGVLAGPFRVRDVGAEHHVRNTGRHRDDRVERAGDKAIASGSSRLAERFMRATASFDQRPNHRTHLRLNGFGSKP